MVTNQPADEQVAGSGVEARLLAPGRSRLRRYLPWVVLLLIALGFARSLGFGFVNWDDDVHVLGNPAVVGAASARDRWLTPALGYPIPVTVASYRIEHRLVGSAPWLYHATNLFLHLGVCGLVYLLGRRVGLGLPAASLAMLFFGLHPVVVEPVSWVSGRKDLLAALFGLAATWCFLRPSAGRGRQTVSMLVAILLFALAVFSKPSALALPVFWALCSLDRPRRPRPALALAFLVAGAAAWLAWTGQSHAGALKPLPSLLVWPRQVLYALGYHLGLALFVQQPLAKHIPAQMPPAFDPAVDLFPLGLGLLLWIWLRRGNDTARSGLLFAAAAYLPSSGIVPLTRFLADSYVYLPLVGLAWLVGLGAERAGAVLRPGWRWAIGAGAASTLLFASSAAALAWQNGISLWTTVHERYPDSPQVCLNLGNAFFQDGKVQRALDIYTRCSRQFGPDHFAKNRAIALLAVGRRAEAAGLLRSLARRFPGDPVVRKYMGLLARDESNARLGD